MPYERLAVVNDTLHHCEAPLMERNAWKLIKRVIYVGRLRGTVPLRIEIKFYRRVSITGEQGCCNEPSVSGRYVSMRDSPRSVGIKRKPIASGHHSCLGLSCSLPNYKCQNITSTMAVVIGLPGILEYLPLISSVERRRLRRSCRYHHLPFELPDAPS